MGGSRFYRHMSCVKESIRQLTPVSLSLVDFLTIVLLYLLLE